MLARQIRAHRERKRFADPNRQNVDANQRRHQADSANPKLHSHGRAVRPTAPVPLANEDRIQIQQESGQREKVNHTRKWNQPQVVFTHLLREAQGRERRVGSG